MKKQLIISILGLLLLTSHSLFAQKDRNAGIINSYLIRNSQIRVIYFCLYLSGPKAFHTFTTVTDDLHAVILYTGICFHTFRFKA